MRLKTLKMPFVRDVAVLVVVVLGVVIGVDGCESGGSKSKPIAGCDAKPGGDIHLRFIAKELRDLNLVSGEPRRSEFDALFDGDHVKADSVPLISWFSKYGNAPDIVIHGMEPEMWGIVIDKQFPDPDAEYRAYCTGWSFDKFAREYEANHG